MECVRDINFTPITNSMYMKPLRLSFTQNNIKKDWDLITVHDSVAILIYHETKKKLLFVKQFRPSVYYCNVPEQDRKVTIDTNVYSPKLGITIELCAGIVDKDKSVTEIAQEEVLEECGYNVPLDKMEKIITCRTSVGISGSKQTIFYCEVNDNMKVNEGGGVDDELIEVVELSIPDLKKYISQDEVNSPPGFLFAIHWFLLNKPQYNV